MTITPALVWLLIAATFASVLGLCLWIRNWPHDPTNDEELP